MESDCKAERARPPLSPLPNTLRCCPRDDTVCTYCGVSYLVLHEIADLEAKILLLEKNQDGEVEWARGALQAACQALVQRELSSARASAESRIQALAEVYDQERAESRDQQRQVLERAREVCEAAHKLAERLFPSEGGGGSSSGARGAVECLDCTSRCLAGLDDALRSTAATADELHAALRRARQAETDLVQARVQNVGLQEEAERCRREAEHARREADQVTASLQEARTQTEALRTQVGEEAAQTARSRDKMRMLTGQAELWRGVARSLEEEKVVQEKMLSELKEQLRQLRVAKAVDPPPQRDEEEKRRVATECVSLRGALRDSQEEIASLRGQKLALQAALRRLESNAQRGAEERQALADALQKARQSHALESERRCSLMAERGEERGVWQEERSWLVAERTRAEAESAALRNTCITLQVQAEQCARQCARMEDTVLRQCEERDALLRALPEPPPAAAPAALRAASALGAASADPTPRAVVPPLAPEGGVRAPLAASVQAPSAALNAPSVALPPATATNATATPSLLAAGLVSSKSSPVLASPSAASQRVAAAAALPTAPPAGLYVQPPPRAATARLAPSAQAGGRCRRLAAVPVQPVLPTMTFTIDATRPPHAARRHGKKKGRK